MRAALGRRIAGGRSATGSLGCLDVPSAIDRVDLVWTNSVLIGVQ
jgi:hypothetical protein